MRLIQLEEPYRLQEYHGKDIPPYAILSHRWAREEVLYSDLTARPSKREFRSARSTKLRRFCEYARTRPVRHWNEQTLEVNSKKVKHGWIDSCCVNGDNSDDVSEVIQSMYAWYQHAAICYVYIHDVDSDQASNTGSLNESEWFKRGWTLQELLAPWDLVFFDKNWQLIGHKCTHGSMDHCNLNAEWRSLFGRSLNLDISEATGIDAMYLRFPGLVSDASIACKMSWAAGREVSSTRVEDKAYCLLGIFDINMPKMYGEGGRRAFQRLQEHLIQSSSDQSIFVWDQNFDDTAKSLLASSPSDFKFGRVVQRLTSSAPASQWWVSEGSLHVQSDVWRAPGGEKDEYVYVMKLNCCFSDEQDPIEIAVSNTMSPVQQQYRAICCDSPGDRRVEKRYTQRKYLPARSFELCTAIAIGPLSIRALCNELSRLPSQDQMRASKYVLRRIVTDFDWETLKCLPQWKHLQLVHDNIALTEAVEGDAVVLEWHATLLKAYTLAKTAKRLAPNGL